MKPRALLSLLSLLAVATVLAAGCRSTQSDPERPGFRVRPGVAFEMAIDAPDMPVLDLRRPDEFDGPLGHLPRAWNVPLEELPRRLAEIRWLRGVTFLVYCRGYGWEAPALTETAEPTVQSAEGFHLGTAEGSDPGSDTEPRMKLETPTPEDPEAETVEPTELDPCGEDAIRFLLSQGFEDAVLLEGGIAAWLDDGYATVGRGAQGPEMDLPEDPGLRVPPGARSIGDPRYLPEPP